MIADRFNPLQRGLHWLMAICIIAMLFIGVTMVSIVAPTYLPLIATHETLGTVIFVLVCIRLVLRLYFGESNLPTPPYIKNACARALAEGHTFYTENAGLPSLRRVIAEHYQRMQNVDLDPAGEPRQGPELGRQAVSQR